MLRPDRQRKTRKPGGGGGGSGNAAQGWERGWEREREQAWVRARLLGRVRGQECETGGVGSKGVGRKENDVERRERYEGRRGVRWGCGWDGGTQRGCREKEKFGTGARAVEEEDG